MKVFFVCLSLVLFLQVNVVTPSAVDEPPPVSDSHGSKEVPPSDPTEKLLEKLSEKKNELEKHDASMDPQSKTSKTSDGGEARISLDGVSFRIEGRTSSREGRLRVRPNSASSWGTVCDDYFDNADARVACYMMGFGRVGRFIGNMYGPGTGTIWLDDLRCTGSESSLGSCPHLGWGRHNCRHSEDVSISCSNTQPPRPGSFSLVSRTCNSITFRFYQSSISSVTGYRYRVVYGSTTQTASGSFTKSSSYVTFRIYNLPRCGSYTYRIYIYAVNSYGITSPYRYGYLSTSSSIIRPPTPGTLYLSSRTCSSLKLRFYQPSTNLITGYRHSVSGYSSRGSYYRSGSYIYYTISGLSRCGSYRYLIYMYATGPGGTSYARTGYFYTASAPTITPGSFTLYSRGCNYLYIRFTQPSYSSVTGYSYYVSGYTSFATWSRSSSTVYFRITNLLYCRSSRYRVCIHAVATGRSSGRCAYFYTTSSKSDESNDVKELEAIDDDQSNNDGEPPVKSDEVNDLNELEATEAQQNKEGLPPDGEEKLTETEEQKADEGTIPGKENDEKQTETEDMKEDESTIPGKEETEEAPSDGRGMKALWHLAKDGQSSGGESAPANSGN